MLDVNTESIKTWTEIISKVASFAAIVAAAWWFFVTTKFKQRIQFDLGCSFHPLDTNADSVVAELQFIFENKGFIEHRLYNLNISVHTLESERELQEKEKTKELLFKKQLLPKVSVVPKEIGFYFVRPGARQGYCQLNFVERKN